MTAPGGLPLKALQFYGAARGAAAQRVSTADFYAALNSAAAGFGLETHGLDFQTVNRLRSAAVQERNAGERFQRAPAANTVDASMISVAPWARSLDDRNAQPIHQIGIYLTTMNDEGELSTEYKALKFTGQLDYTKQDLLTLIQQDAEALADVYGSQYIEHSVTEIRAI